MFETRDPQAPIFCEGKQLIVSLATRQHAVLFLAAQSKSPTSCAQRGFFSAYTRCNPTRVSQTYTHVAGSGCCARLRMTQAAGDAVPSYYCIYSTVQQRRGLHPPCLKYSPPTRKSVCLAPIFSTHVWCSGFIQCSQRPSELSAFVTRVMGPTASCPRIAQGVRQCRVSVL